MRLLRTLLAATLSAVVALGVGACSSDDVIEGDVTTTTPTTPPAAPDGDGSATDPAALAAVAADRAAKSELRNAITSAKTIATDFDGRYQQDEAGTPIDAARFGMEAPDLKFGPAGSATADVVSVLVRDESGRNSDIWLVTASTAGSYFCIHGTAGAVTHGIAASEDEAIAGCDAESWPGD